MARTPCAKPRGVGDRRYKTLGLIDLCLRVQRTLRLTGDADATEQERAIREVNSGIYVFDGTTLFETLPNVGNDNQQGEYYLTDVLERLVSEGKKVEAIVFKDASILKGVNDRWQLADAYAPLQSAQHR